MIRLKGLVFFAAAVLIALSGCAKPAPKCVSPEDNAEHHYLRGMELLDAGKASEAAAKLERAVYCEGRFAPAHAGLSIVEAMKATAAKPEGYMQVDVDRSMEHLRRAQRHSKTPEDEFAYYVAYMRVNTILKPQKWLKETEGAYKDAMKLKLDERRLLFYDVREAATYFMGAAYLDAREFASARDRFVDVLNARQDGKWHSRADRLWKKTDKIVRSLAGITVGYVGSEIAVKDSVARGDMAALLIDELKIERLFAGRIPVASEAQRRKAEFTPADIMGSQFKDEILTLMKWGVRGMEPVYDETTRAYLFRPSEPVTRKEFALVLEDVLVKLTGDQSLASAFFGHERSPYPDVPATSAWYNAIMSVTTRSIMETELSGEFRPNDAVDGAEAMLAIRVLRQRLNIH